MGKKRDKADKGGGTVVPEPRKAEGKAYLCTCSHEDPQERGFRKYKAGQVETFEKAPPAAFWRLQDEIKETEA